MAQPNPSSNTETPLDDTPVNIDHIYNNLGFDQDPDPSTTNTEQHTAEEPSQGAGTTDPVPGTPPANGATPPATEVPLQPNASDVDALRRQHDQLTRTYIPALERERDRAVQSLNQIQQTVQGLTQFRERITSHGLSPDEASIGLQMAAAYKSNPGDFLLKLIRNAQANGVQLPEGVPNAGLDANSISQVIDQRLRPLLEPLQARQQEAQQNQAIQQHIASFYTDFPDARVQQTALARYITHQSGLGRQVSLHNAYIELYKWSAANGLDWNQPLEAQVAARQTNPPSNPPPQQPNLGTSRRSINPSQVNTPSEQFDPKLSWKEIFARVRAEHGR